MCLLVVGCHCSQTFSWKELENICLPNRHLHSYLSIDWPIKSYDFTSISPMPTYHHKIHSGFVPFQICNSLLWQWEILLPASLKYFLLCSISLYVSSILWLLDLFPPATQMPSLSHSGSETAYMAAHLPLPTWTHIHTPPTLTQMSSSSVPCSNHPRIRILSMLLASVNALLSLGSNTLHWLHPPQPCHTETISSPFLGSDILHHPSPTHIPSSPHGSSSGISLLGHTPHFVVALMAYTQLSMPSPSLQMPSSLHVGSHATPRFLPPPRMLILLCPHNGFWTELFGKGRVEKGFEGKGQKGKRKCREKRKEPLTALFIIKKKKDFVYIPGSANVQCKKQTTPGVLSGGIYLR